MLHPYRKQRPVKNCGVFALFSLLLALVLLRPDNAHARQKPELVRIYTIEEFDYQGKPTPVDSSIVQLLQVISENTGLQFEVVRVPWKRAMDKALQGDGILLGMSITKERQKKFAFSEPINVNRNWLITRCDKQFAFNSIADLKGKLIGVVLGTSAGDAFDQEINKTFRIENDTGAGFARIQKLIRGRMDALVWYGATHEVGVMEAHINRHFLGNADGLGANSSAAKDHTVCVLKKPVSTVTNHFAMKLDPEKNVLLARLSQAMTKARKEGRLASIASLLID